LIPSDKSHLVLSCGEDFSIKLLKWNGSNKVELVANLERRVCTLKKLCYFSKNRDFFIVCGGSLEYVSFFRVSSKNIELLAETGGSVLSPHTSLQDRLDQCDVHICSLATVCTEAIDQVLVFSGNSLGQIKAYTWNHVSKTVALLTCLSHGRPILALKHVSMKGLHLLLGGDTKGRVCVWNISSFFGSSDLAACSIELCLSLEGVHQSGVNCIDVHVASSSRFIVCSGGDDESLALLFFEIDDLKEVR
jgi:WD40 repeat protein